MKFRDKETQRAYNSTYEEWRQLAFDSQGRECQVRKYRPDVKVRHTDILQVDHLIPRGFKKTHFDPRNATVVCSGCNFRASLPNNPARGIIRKIRIQQEGGESIEEMERWHEQGLLERNWGKAWWFLEWKEKLAGMRTFLRDISKKVGGTDV